MINSLREFFELFAIFLNVERKIQALWLIFRFATHSIERSRHLFVNYLLRLLDYLPLGRSLIQELIHHAFVIELFQQVMLVFVMRELLLRNVGLVYLGTSVDILADVLERSSTIVRLIENGIKAISQRIVDERPFTLIFF